MYCPRLPGIFILSIAQNETGPEAGQPRCETRIGASPLDIAITVVVSPVILVLFLVTLIGHGLRGWR